jgi:hypothetical protein
MECANVKESSSSSLTTDISIVAINLTVVCRIVFIVVGGDES